MGRIKETRRFYKEVINEISKSEENWQNFLDCSSWNFKYDFDDQILIYAQRPNAKACATMEEWNKKLKRWVNSGTKPIYIFDKNPYSEYPFKLVFDLSDTHNYNNTEYKLWSIKKEYEQHIIESLEANFGDMNTKESLSQAISIASYNMVIDNMEDYLISVINNKTNSMLENMSDEEIRSIFTLAVWASVKYMIMTRCNINAKQQIETQEFSYIKFFNNQELLTILGTSISDIAENSNILNNIITRIKSLTDFEYLEFLKNEGIKSNREICEAIMRMVTLIENTKLHRKKGEYIERIKKDSILYDIYVRANNTKFSNVKEIGYFVYHELCLHFKENTESFFEEENKRIAHYNDFVSSNYNGICKNMSEVYADIMQMLGQRVELVVRDPIISEFPHVDAVLLDDINGERYFMNLIGDIYRVRSQRICKLYGELPGNSYKMRIESLYGALTPISEEEIRMMDKKMGYLEQNGKYTNEIIDELLDEEKNIDLTFFERICKYIKKSNTELKTMDNTGYIEATQHFRNPVIKMAFNKIISREDYFNKFIGFDCVRNGNLMEMQWVINGME